MKYCTVLINHTFKMILVIKITPDRQEAKQAAIDHIIRSDNTPERCAKLIWLLDLPDLVEIDGRELLVTTSTHLHENLEHEHGYTVMLDLDPVVDEIRKQSLAEKARLVGQAERKR